MTRSIRRNLGSRRGIITSISAGLVDSEKQDEKVKYFDDRNHLIVLCQSNGSVWPKVFPYCLANTAFAAVLWYVVKKRNIHFGFSQDANSYMASLLAFLVVSRVRMIYTKSMHSRGELTNLCKSCEELVQNATSLTLQNNSRKAQKWRHRLAYLTCLLLKQTMHALRRHSELLKEDMTDELDDEDSANFQKPARMAYKLRTLIAQHGLDDLKSSPLMIARLTQFVDQFTAAFYELEGISRTSFPFPLVQMARTILTIWLIFLPLGLCQEKYPLWGICMLVFLLTFGFVGLETVSVEMSDPFGVDDTDFDLFFMAEVTFEDIYIILYNVDGQKAAEELVNKIRNQDLEKLYSGNVI